VHYLINKKGTYAIKEVIKKDDDCGEVSDVMRTALLILLTSDYEEEEEEKEMCEKCDK
jgi:hypothetical protein